MDESDSQIDYRDNFRSVLGRTQHLKTLNDRVNFESVKFIVTAFKYTDCSKITSVTKWQCIFSSMIDENYNPSGRLLSLSEIKK